MRLAILFVCAGVVLGKPADPMSSTQGQPIAAPAHLGSNIAQEPLVKIAPFSEEDQNEHSQIQEIPPNMQNSTQGIVPMIKIRKPDGPDQHQFYAPGHAIPMEGLFGNLSSEAMEEYANLTQNANNVTIAEIKKMTVQWAEKNGIKEQLEDLKAKVDSKRTEFIANATLIVNALPSMFQQLIAITKNDEQTFAEMENAIAAFFQTLDPATKQIMATIVRVGGIDMLLAKFPNGGNRGLPAAFNLSNKMLLGDSRTAPPQFQRFLHEMSHPESDIDVEGNKEE